MISTQEKFWSSVPPCGNIFSEDISLLVMEERSGQSEITNFEITVGIDEKISGFLNEWIFTKSL